MGASTVGTAEVEVGTDTNVGDEAEDVAAPVGADAGDLERRPC